MNKSENIYQQLLNLIGECPIEDGRKIITYTCSIQQQFFIELLNKLDDHLGMVGDNPMEATKAEYWFEAHGISIKFILVNKPQLKQKSRWEFNK